MQTVRFEAIREIPITIQVNVLRMITAVEVAYNDKLIDLLLSRVVKPC